MTHGNYGTNRHDGIVHASKIKSKCDSNQNDNHRKSDTNVHIGRIHGSDNNPDEYAKGEHGQKKKGRRGNNRRFTKRSRYRRLNHKKMIQQNKDKAVHNFSNVTVTKDITNLLSKGLKFSPTPKRLNITQLKVDMFHMERKFGWKYHFTTSNEQPMVKDPVVDPYVRNSPFEKEIKTNLPRKYP